MRAREYAVVLSVLVFSSGSRTVGATAELLPAGTALNVRIIQPIDADFAHVGVTFEAVVDDPVAAGGQILIDRGAIATLGVVRVQRSVGLKGRERITFKVHSVRVGGRTYPVATSYVEVKGATEGKKRETRKIVEGTGISATAGSLFEGGPRAGWGAPAGGTNAAIMAGTGNTNLRVPAETRLQFQLTVATWIER